jgi:hypothetical protein
MLLVEADRLFVKTDGYKNIEVFALSGLCVIYHPLLAFITFSIIVNGTVDATGLLQELLTFGFLILMECYAR